MKLISITLHPFGGIMNRTYTLQDGVQALLGPNEYGKSTFRAALEKALFVPTDLTAAKLRDLIGPWLPLPGGKSARVTLTLEHNGKHFRLEKQWGAGHSSRLVDETTATSTDGAREVQAALDEMRHHSASSYQRVFVAEQSAIADTVNALRSDGSQLVNAAAAIAAGTRHVTGDVDLEGLRAQLQCEIDDASRRWNSVARGPECNPRTGQGSPENPWRNDVGEILQTWYVWKNAERAVTVRMAHERRADELNARILARDSELTDLEPRIAAAETRLRQLHERAPIERAIERLEREAANQRSIFEQWQKAQTRLPELQKQATAHEETIRRLETERALRQKHERAALLKQQMERIANARADVAAAANDLDACKKVAKADADRLAKLNQQIERVDVSIQAQKLSATLLSDQTTRVHVVTGTDPAQTIELHAGQPVQLKAAGQMITTVGSVQVKVRSDMEDIDALMSRRTDLERELTAGLNALNCVDLADARAAADVRAKADARLEQARAMHHQALQGRAEEEWKRSADEIESLPPCRSEDQIKAELDPIVAERARCTVEITQHDASITEWTAAYHSLNKLDESRVDLLVQLRDARTRLDKLPAPEGGPVDLGTLDQAVADMRARRDAASHERAEARQSLAALGSPEDEDLGSLQDTAVTTETDHRRALARHDSKCRVVKAIDGMRGNTNPFSALESRIQTLMQALSLGSYATLAPEAGLPTALLRKDGTPIPATQISRGTAASLALAVRIALIENLLEQSGMFVLLDDPLVDLDAGRRAAAAEALRALGESAQVIVLTCHETHAAELGPGRVTVA